MSTEGEVLENTGEPRVSEIEVRARELGWVPKDEFRGDPEKWTDAQAYVEYGEQMLPIVKATNKRLKDELAAERNERTRLAAEVESTKGTVQALQEYHASELKTKLEQQRKKLVGDIAAANREGEHERAAELTADLSRVDAEAAVAAKTPPPPANKPAGEAPVDPRVKEWQEQNPWYGTDLGRTSIAQGVAAQLVNEKTQLRGRDFLDEVAKRTSAELKRLGVGTTQPPRESKLEPGQGGRGGPGGGGGNGKSYNDLPSDARAECDKFTCDARLVGPTKLHKDVAAARKYWTDMYFSEV